MADRLDQAEVNGRLIPDLARRGVLEELKAQVVRCPCRSRDGKPNGPALARFYVGPEEGTDRPRGWVWVPSFRHGSGKTPPTATSIAEFAGDPVWTLHAQCSKCRSWWLVIPGELPEVDEMTGRTVIMSYRPGTSSRERHAVGDPTVAGVVTSDRISGPGPVLLIRVESSTWGSVAP